MPDFQVERVYILFLKLLKARHLIFMGIVSQICDARMRISHSKFSSPKTCRNIDKSSFKIGHTSDPSPSQTLKRANDDSGSLIRMRAWSSRNCMTSQTCKRRKHALTFLVFPSVKFCKSLYTSWYRCLLHNIIF